MKQILDPKKIENESFRIVERFLEDSLLPFEERQIVKRIIHATTDPDYIKNIYFHPDAVSAGLEAIRSGSDIICDVNMVRAGINKKILAGFGGSAVCLIDDKNVIRQASRLGIARAILAMRRAAKLMDGAVIAVGNAPTALFEVCDLIRLGKARPALVIGVPVGFVGAADSKKELASLGIPCITNSGTKGGSSVAAAAVNALLNLAKERP